MYVIQTTAARLSNQQMHYQHELQEITAAEARTIPADAWSNRPVEGFTTFEKVSADRARRWVRNGKHHTTPLYLDGDRILYARG